MADPKSPTPKPAPQKPDTPEPSPPPLRKPPDAPLTQKRSKP